MSVDTDWRLGWRKTPHGNWWRKVFGYRITVFLDNYSLRWRYCVVGSDHHPHFGREHYEAVEIAQNAAYTDVLRRTGEEIG